MTARSDRAEAVGVNPHVAPLIAPIIEACREAGVERVTLFGSSTQPEDEVVPRDIDLMVGMGGAEGSAERYFALRARLGEITGLDVDLVDERAVRNPYLKAEIQRTGVVIRGDGVELVPLIPGRRMRGSLCGIDTDVPREKDRL